MAESLERKKPKIRYGSKKNCKRCYGRGVIILTLPEPARRVLCGCVKKVTADEEDSNAKAQNEQKPTIP